MKCRWSGEFQTEHHHNPNDVNVVDTGGFRAEIRLFSDDQAFEAFFDAAQDDISWCLNESSTCISPVQPLFHSPMQLWNPFCHDEPYAALIILFHDNEASAHCALPLSQPSTEPSLPSFINQSSFSHVIINFIRSIEKDTFNGCSSIFSGELL